MTDATTGATACVLIVESDAADAGSVRDSFAAHGWPMAIAQTGEQALAMLADSQKLPRCILLDLRLRGPMTGFDLLVRLRSEARTARLPVIIYTSDYTKEDLVRAFDLGASSVIRRPVESPAKVLALVEFFLGDLENRVRDARVRVKRQFLELQARTEHDATTPSTGIPRIDPTPPSGLAHEPRDSWFR